jgi:hypothetical protein
MTTDTFVTKSTYRANDGRVIESTTTRTVVTTVTSTVVQLQGQDTSLAKRASVVCCGFHFGKLGSRLLAAIYRYAVCEVVVMCAPD